MINSMRLLLNDDWIKLVKPLYSYSKAFDPEHGVLGNAFTQNPD